MGRVDAHGGNEDNLEVMNLDKAAVVNGVR
jgi:hypothetical protein